MTYGFFVDLGDGGDELILREFFPSSKHKSFPLPSSRATIKDPHFGWILCRLGCPVTLIAEVRDLHHTSTRWKTVMHLHRPGCVDKIAPCSNAVMLDIVDTSLRSVDVYAADLQPINALMLLLAAELSDLHLFSVNGTVGASPKSATLRSKSSGLVSPIHPCLHSISAIAHAHSLLLLTRVSIQGRLGALSPEVQEVSKLKRTQQQDRIRQRCVLLLVHADVCLSVYMYIYLCSHQFYNVLAYKYADESVFSGLQFLTYHCVSLPFSRMESISLLRDLETQGLYAALQKDIAEALDIDISALNISSGENPSLQGRRGEKEEDEAIAEGAETRLNIHQSRNEDED